MSEVSVDYGAYAEVQETRSAFSGVSSSYTQGTLKIETSLGSDPIEQLV